MDQVNDLMHEQWLNMADSYTRVTARGGDPLREVEPEAQMVDPEVALQFIPGEWAKRQAAREKFINDDPMVQSAMKLHENYMERFKLRNEAPLVHFRPNMSDQERAIWQAQLQKEPMPDEVQQQLLDTLNYANTKLKEIDPAMDVSTDSSLRHIARNMESMAIGGDAVFAPADPTPTGSGVLARTGAAFVRAPFQGGELIANGLTQIGLGLVSGLDSDFYEEYLRTQAPDQFMLTRDGDMVHNGGKISPEASPYLALKLLAGASSDEIINLGKEYEETFNWSQAQVGQTVEVYANGIASALGFLTQFMGTGGGAIIGQTTRLMHKGAVGLITSSHKGVSLLGKTLARVGGAGVGTALWEMGVNGRVDGYAHAAIEGLKMGPIFALAGAAGQRLGKYLEKYEKMPPRLKRVYEGMLEGAVLTAGELTNLSSSTWSFMRDPTNPDKVQEFSVGLVSSMLSFGLFKGATGTTPGEMTTLDKILSPAEKARFITIQRTKAAQRTAAKGAVRPMEVQDIAETAGARPETVKRYGDLLRKQAADPKPEIEAEILDLESRMELEKFARDMDPNERANARVEIREHIDRLMAEGAEAAEIAKWQDRLDIVQEPGGEPGQLYPEKKEREPRYEFEKKTELENVQEFIRRGLGPRTWRSSEEMREAEAMGIKTAEEYYDRLEAGTLPGEPIRTVAGRKPPAREQMLQEGGREGLEPEIFVEQRDKARRERDRFLKQGKDPLEDPDFQSMDPALKAELLALPSKKARLERMADELFPGREGRREGEAEPGLPEGLRAMSAEHPGSEFKREIQKKVYDAFQEMWPDMDLVPSMEPRGGLDIQQLNMMTELMMQGKGEYVKRLLATFTEAGEGGRRMPLHEAQVAEMYRVLKETASPEAIERDYGPFEAMGPEDLRFIKENTPEEYVREIQDRVQEMLIKDRVALPEGGIPTQLVGDLIWARSARRISIQEMKRQLSRVEGLDSKTASNIAYAIRDALEPRRGTEAVPTGRPRHFLELTALMQSKVREQIENRLRSDKKGKVARLPLEETDLETVIEHTMRGDQDLAHNILRNHPLLEDMDVAVIERVLDEMVSQEALRKAGWEDVLEYEDFGPDDLRFAKYEPEPGAGARAPNLPPTPGRPKSLDLKAQDVMWEHPAVEALEKKWGRIEQPDIVKRMEGQVGDPVQIAIRKKAAMKGGGIGKNVMGWFDTRQHLSRLRDMRNEALAAHEFSHAMEEMAHKRGIWDPINVPQWMRDAFAKTASTYPNYDKLSPREQIAEGWAEFWARHSLDDPSLWGESPQLYDAMMKWISSEPAVTMGFERQFREVQELMRYWRLMGAERRMQSLRRPPGAKPTEMQQRASMGFVERVTTGFSKYMLDDIVELKKAESKWLKKAELDASDIPISLSPSRLIDAFRMTARRQAEMFWEQGTHDINGNRTGESAGDILRELGPDLENFIDYVVARRMVNLIDQGYEMPGNRQDAMFVVEKWQRNKPEFISYAQRMREFSNRVLDYAVQAGTLTEAERNNLIKTNPVYIPFQRIIEFGGKQVSPVRGIAERGTGIAPMRGGPEQLRDPIEAFKDSIKATITKAQQSMVMRSMYLQHKMLKRMGGFVTEVPRDVEPREVLVERIQEEIKRLGSKRGKKQEAKDLADKLEKLLGGGPGAAGTAMTFWFQKAVPTGAAPVIAFRPKFSEQEIQRLGLEQMPPTRKGFKNLAEEVRADESQIVWLEVDPMAYNALMAVDAPGMWLENAPPLLRSLVLAPTQMVRWGATILNPDFIVRNMIRDPMTRQLFTKHGDNKAWFFSGFGALMKGAANEAKNVEGVRIYKALGLEGTTRVGIDIGREARGPGTYKSFVGGLRTVAEFLGKPEGWLRNDAFIETRERLLKEGATEFDATMEAALQSKEETVNFTRAGIIGRQLTQIYPYFSPRMAGLRKFWRSATGLEGGQAQTQALMRGIINLGGLSALAWWFNKDKEWYQDLPLWRRVNFWTFDMNFTGEGDPRLISIPKPFEAGVMFGSGMENILTAFDDYDPEMTKDIMTELIAQHLVGFPFIPAPILPILESKVWDAERTGYSYFFNRPIVPDWQIKSRVPEDQFNAYTSMTFRWLGDAFGVSPTKLEYMVSQYWGGLPRRIAQSVEALAGINQSAWRANSIPGFGTLFSQSAHQFGRAEDTLHDIEFQLGRLSGSDRITPRGRNFRARVNRARERLRRIRKLQRDNRITLNEANRRAFDVSRRLAEQWENMKESDYVRTR